MNELALEACGLPEKSTKEYRICSAHKKVLVVVKREVERENNKPKVFNFTFCLPERMVKTRSLGSGLAGDRYLVKEIKNMPNDAMKNITMFSMVCAIGE